MVVVTSVLLMVGLNVGVVVSPIIVALEAANQEYVLGRFDVREKFKVSPEQITSVEGLVIVGIGFTEIETIWGKPSQEPKFDEDKTV